MKKTIFSLCLLLSVIFTATSQEFSYGLVGGVNYAMGGQITGTSGVFTGTTLEGSGELGFHGGAFLQVDFGQFFVRPEIKYSTLETVFDFNKPSSYSVERFAIPLMIGTNIYGPIDIYAGPVYSNILNVSLEGNSSPNTIVVQDSPINAQIGAKVEFGRFGIDIRYEHSLSSEQPQSISSIDPSYGLSSANFDNTRLNQIIVGIILKLGGPGLNQRRGRTCY